MWKIKNILHSKSVPLVLLWIKPLGKSQEKCWTIKSNGNWLMSCQLQIINTDAFETLHQQDTGTKFSSGNFEVK